MDQVSSMTMSILKIVLGKILKLLFITSCTPTKLTWSKICSFWLCVWNVSGCCPSPNYLKWIHIATISRQILVWLIKPWEREIEREREWWEIKREGENGGRGRGIQNSLTMLKRIYLKVGELVSTLKVIYSLIFKLDIICQINHQTRAVLIIRKFQLDI